MAESHTPVSAAPVPVYTPAKVGTPHAVLINEGQSTAYIGQAGVTSTNGFPLPPNAEIDLPFAPTALYAAAGGVVTGSPSTTTTAAAAAGATSLSVTSETGFTGGKVALVGTGTGAEVVTVLSNSTGVINIVGKLAYDHASGVTVAAVASSAGTAIHTVAGTT